MTAGLRQSPPDAVRASRTTAPDWPAIGRRLGFAAVVGLFLSLIGASGSYRAPILQRTVMMVAISILAVAMGTLAYRLAGRSRRLAAHWILHGLAAALLMTAPIAVVVWAVLQFVVRPAPPLAALPGFLPMSLANSLFFCLWAAQRVHSRRITTPPVAADPGPPRFLDRLPPKLRGAELYAVEAEDHYLRLHTSRGQDLILMRLADAVAELGEAEGARTHRSWWVARAAITAVRRADGRAVLTLKNAAEAPVSRSHGRLLRARGWL